VEKYCTARQATGDNMIQYMHIACWITKAKDTPGMCNNYCISTATMVTEMHLSIFYTYTACLVFSVLYSIYHSCQEYLKDDSNNSYF